MSAPMSEFEARAITNKIGHGLTDIQSHLDDLEAIIAAGLQTFTEVGTALTTIRDSKLYLLGWDTFEDYCRERWSISRQHAYRLMDHAEVVGAISDAAGLSPAGDISERTARAIKPHLHTVTDAIRQAPERAAEIVAEGLDFPAALAVRLPDDSIYYAAVEQATWREVVAGLTERQHNVIGATSRLDRYAASMDRLRPFMEHDPEMTVGAAHRQMVAAEAAA